MTDNRFPAPSDIRQIVTPQPAASDTDLVFNSGGVAPGTYDGRVARIDGPKIVEWQGGELALLEWTVEIATDEGVEEVSGSTSTKTGNGSKLVAWTTALIGRQPHAGERIPRSALIGRRCTVLVETSEKGYSKIAAILPPRTQPARDDRPAAILDDMPF